MKTKSIRVAFIIAAAAALLAVYCASSYLNAQGPAEIDMAAVIEKLSANAGFEYSFISADQLQQATVIWQQPIPSRVRDILSLGPDNMLVVCESDLPSPSAFVKPTEETICIFDSMGNMLAQKFIGEYKVRNVYQSYIGSLVNIETEKDHDILNIITDRNGSSFVQIGYRFVLVPSWNGEYLIKKIPLGRGLESVATIDAMGQKTTAAATRFMNKDGSSKIMSMAEDLHEEKKLLLWAFDNNDLLFAGRDSAETASKLILYNIIEGRKAWERQVPPLTSVDAICSEKDGQGMYLLLSTSANARGVQDFVISRTNGEIVSESFGMFSWESIGSNDGFFYSEYSEPAPAGEFPKHRFILKHTPRFEIERYGVLCEYCAMHSMKLCDEYLYGLLYNCTLNDKTLICATAIYNMGGNLPESDADDLLLKKAKPVILEGTWFIKSVTADQVVLIGQLTPDEDYLTKIMIQRSVLQ